MWLCLISWLWMYNIVFEHIHGLRCDIEFHILPCKFMTEFIFHCSSVYKSVWLLAYYKHYWFYTLCLAFANHPQSKAIHYNNIITYIPRSWFYIKNHLTSKGNQVLVIRVSSDKINIYILSLIYINHNRKYRSTANGQKLQKKISIPGSLDISDNVSQILQ